MCEYIIAEINESRNVFRKSTPWPTAYPPFAQPQGKGLISMVFPPGTSIGIYNYFTYFSQFCKREKTGIQSKFHDCSKFICRNHRSFGAFYIGIYVSEDGGPKAIMRSLKPQGVRLYRYLCTFQLFLHLLPPLCTSWNGSSGKYLSSLP